MWEPKGRRRGGDGVVAKERRGDARCGEGRQGAARGLMCGEGGDVASSGVAALAVVFLSLDDAAPGVAAGCGGWAPTGGWWAQDKDEVEEKQGEVA